MTNYKSSGNYMSYKQVAKWIKSKGRGKLRNYCTMCSRQFRDKKGLKNHMGSKQHLERMAEFNRNPEHYLQKFSDDFQRGYLDILIRMYGDKKVFARTVYTEYCHILHHRHLNSTSWSSLDEFVEHLGKQGICKIEKGPKGYYVEYLGRVEPELEKEEVVKKKKKRKMKVVKTKEVKKKKRVKKKKPKIKDRGTMKKNDQEEFDPNEEINTEVKVTVLYQAPSDIPKNFENVFKKPQKRKREPNNDSNDLEQAKKKKKLIHGWIYENIVVKVIHKKFENGSYHKKKGIVVKALENGTVARIKMFKSQDVIQLQQKYLETVIPKISGRVMILRGEHASEIAVLKEVKIKEFAAVVDVVGKEIKLPYEHFSKFKM